MSVNPGLILEAVCIGSACASAGAYAVSQLADRALQKLVVGGALRDAHGEPPPNDAGFNDQLRRLEEAEHAPRG